MANEFPSITRTLNNTLNQQNSILQKLSSGRRINRAQDDAAGLAIAASLEASISTLAQGTRNANDAQSAIQIADSAMEQVGNMSARMKELATEASNGTLSDTQRASLNSEYQQLAQEMSRITATTEFNGQQLLGQEGFTVQVGNGADANSQITVSGIDGNSNFASAVSQDISTRSGAMAALGAIDTTIQNIASARGDLGAISARLDTATANNSARAEAESGALSRIRDLDYAQETANKVSNDIRLNANAALAGQANNLQATIVQKLLS